MKEEDKGSSAEDEKSRRQVYHVVDFGGCCTRDARQQCLCRTYGSSKDVSLCMTFPGTSHRSWCSCGVADVQGVQPERWVEHGSSQQI